MYLHSCYDSPEKKYASLMIHVVIFYNITFIMCGNSSAVLSICWIFFSEQISHLDMQQETINMVTKLHKKLRERKTLHWIIYLSRDLFLHWCILKSAVFSRHFQNQEIAFENFSRRKSDRNLLNALNMSEIDPFKRRWSWSVTQVSSEHAQLSHSL